MGVGAWCGHCGESFALLELVEPDGDVPVGSCPRCGAAFASGYTAVLVSAVRQLATAAEALHAAAAQLHDIAPALHVDVRTLTGDLQERLGH